MTNFQINGKDLDDILQPRFVGNYTLAKPSIDFVNYNLNGISLEGRYARSFNPWHKKMQKSYLSNSKEIDVCLKGYYPLDRSFSSFGAGIYALTRNDTQLQLTTYPEGAIISTWTASHTTFNGIIPKVVLIAICAGGGAGSGGNGSKAGAAGGGGAMGMYALNFNTADVFHIEVGAAGIAGNGSGGNSIIYAYKGDLVDKVILGGGKGGQGQVDARSPAGTILHQNSNIAIISVSGVCKAGSGGGTTDDGQGEGSNWDWYWGSSKATSPSELSSRTGSVSGGAKPGNAGGGGSSFGQGGSGGHSSHVKGYEGTRGGGGGGGTNKIFNGGKGANGGAGYVWLYY